MSTFFSLGGRVFNRTISGLGRMQAEIARWEGMSMRASRHSASTRRRMSPADLERVAAVERESNSRDERRERAVAERIEVDGGRRLFEHLAMLGHGPIEHLSMIAAVSAPKRSRPVKIVTMIRVRESPVHDVFFEKLMLFGNKTSTPIGLPDLRAAAAELGDAAEIAIDINEVADPILLAQEQQNRALMKLFIKAWVPEAYADRHSRHRGRQTPSMGCSAIAGSWSTKRVGGEEVEE